MADETDQIVGMIPVVAAVGVLGATNKILLEKKKTAKSAKRTTLFELARRK